MRRLLSISLFFLAILICAPAGAKTLTSIAVLPPVTGYWVVSTTNTGTVQLSVLCTYSDLSTDNCTAAGGVTWFSDNPAAMTINSSGLVTGAGAPTWSSATNYATGAVVTYSGNIYYAVNTNTNNIPNAGNICGAQACWIRAPFGVNIVAYNGTIFGRAIVDVTDTAVTCMNIRPESEATPTLTVGSTAILGAEDCTTGNNINGFALGDFVAWTSGTPSVATVNSFGEVTGVSAGSSVMTANVGGFTATKTVTVTNPTITNTTYYVRPGGGTRWSAAVPTGQCTGLSDVDYPGSGTGVACAFNNWMYCFTDESTGGSYTGAVQGGDECYIRPPTASAGYNIIHKNLTTTWVTNGPFPGTITVPSGTPSNPTKIIGASPGILSTSLGGTPFFFYDTQNVEVQNLNIQSGVDCNSALGTGLSGGFSCPSGITNGNGMIVDEFTNNIVIDHTTIDGYSSAIGGTPGPGTVFSNDTVNANNLAGTNFDNVNGYTGGRADGFILENSDDSYSGCTTDQPKALSGGSVSRDGAGNLNVTFPSGSIVNYIVGNNLVLTGMTPSDLNGTFPVTSITFNQQTVTITGGSVTNINGNGTTAAAAFTTSAAPTFGVGAFVNVSGATPSYLNGTYEVIAVSTSVPFGFTISASTVSRAGWVTSGSTISAAGTASTAVSLVATAAGSSESASVLGFATHVLPFHRCVDQFNGGFANGDGIGTGNSTRGVWKALNNTIRRNTQDGWDMVHSQMALDVVEGNLSEGNQGAPWKAGFADVAQIYNNVGVANCAVNVASPDPNRPPEYDQYISFTCRASDAMPVTNVAWSTMTIVNNTLSTAQNTLMDDGCGSPIGCNGVLPFANFIFQNNLILGFTDTNNITWNLNLPAIYFSEYSGNGGQGGPSPNWVFSNNIAFNMRNPPTGGTGNQWTTNPLVVQAVPNITTLAGETNALYVANQYELTGSSPAIGAGIHNSYTPTLDFNGVTRPNPPSIGAYEIPSGIAAPTQLQGVILQGVSVQ